MVCSRPFTTLARGQARSNGDPELPLVLIDHPLGGMVEATVRERVEQALPQVLAYLRSMVGP